MRVKEKAPVGAGAEMESYTLATAKYTSGVSV